MCWAHISLIIVYTEKTAKNTINFKAKMTNNQKRKLQKQSVIIRLDKSILYPCHFPEIISLFD